MAARHDVVVASSLEVSGEEEENDGIRYPEREDGTKMTWEEMTVEQRLKAVGFVRYEYDPEERARNDKLAKMWLGWGYDEFDEAIAEFAKNRKPPPLIGERVKGTVLDVTPEYCLVRVNKDNILKCFVEELSLGDLGRPTDVFRRGEVREFTVIGSMGRDPDSHLMLSCMEEQIEMAWTRIRQLQAEDIAVKAYVVEVNRGGMIVEYEDLQGFIPGSHLSAEYTNAPEDVVGAEIPVKFIEVDEERDRLVLSNRRATAEASLSGHKVGDVVKGVVSAIKPFGAFVDIGGVNGLLHISQISHDRITSVENLLTVGDELKVMIIAQDRERGRVSLSTKKLEPSPGDMLRNPQLVYDKAEEIAATFRERVAAAEAAARAEEDMLAAQARAALLGEEMPSADPEDES